MKSGMNRDTASKYIRDGTLPSEIDPVRDWRTVPISQELNMMLEVLGGGSGKTTTFNISRRRGSGDDDGGGEYVLPRLTEWRQGRQARVLKQFCSSIGLLSIKFHTLRACFATQLISDGIEPIKVMKVSGWQDLKTMARYVRLAGIEELGITDNLRILPLLSMPEYCQIDTWSQVGTN
jgi:integrase